MLGAVSLGARAIEKHFTDDRNREGPDHPFSLDPAAWSEMVARTHELEYAMGDGNKIVEPNERDTVVIQRRSLRAAKNLKAGQTISESDLEALRPAPRDAIFPFEIDRVVGRKLTRDILKGDYPKWTDVG